MKLKNNKGVFYLLEQNFNLKCYRKHYHKFGAYRDLKKVNFSK